MPQKTRIEFLEKR